MKHEELCDPFSEKDHEEILNSVGKNVRIKHKAQCVWFTVGFNAPRSEIDRWCKLYGISYEDVMKWKDYMYNLWLKDQEAKAERESRNSI